MRSFNNTHKKILFYAKVQHYLLHFITLGFFLPLFSVLHYSQRTSSAFTGNISFKETATDEQMLNTDTPGLRKIPSQGVVFHRRCLNSICFSPLAASQPVRLLTVLVANCSSLNITEGNETPLKDDPNPFTDITTPSLCFVLTAVCLTYWFNTTWPGSLNAHIRQTLRRMKSQHVLLTQVLALLCHTHHE